MSMRRGNMRKFDLLSLRGGGDHLRAIPRLVEEPRLALTGKMDAHFTAL